jgi:hypothetical protein
MTRVQLSDALKDREAVLRTFLTPEGRLTQIPTKLRKRLVVLDHLAQEFAPGERYPEVEVNNRMRAYHDDVAALRRYLVEEEFLERRDGEYWRCGGTLHQT